MSERATARSFGPFAWIAAASGAAMLALIEPVAVWAGWFLLAWFLVLAWRQRLFGVWGYLCAAAIYYWIGIANPFGADIHGVVIDHALSRALVGLVMLGSVCLAAGAWLGARAAGRNRREPQALDFPRLYRAAAVCLVLGLIAVVGVYLRFGAPALADVPDVAREEVSTLLSPYTQYQWLLIDIGICLTAIGYARDVDASRRLAQRLLVGLSLLSGILLALYASRILLAAPFIAGVIAWTRQGKKIPRRLIAFGVALALAVVSVGWLARLSAAGAFTLYNIDFDLGSGYMAGLKSLAGAVTIFARTSIEIFALFVSGQLPKLSGEVAFMSVIALLPGHQPVLGLFRITQLLGYEGATGTTVSLFGGMYADFGVPGVVLESALLGGLLGWLGRRAREGDGLDAVFYAVAFTYYLATIYGGVLLDVTLLWKFWVGALAVRYVRGGSAFDGAVGAAALATVALYAFGLLHLFF